MKIWSCYPSVDNDPYYLYIVASYTVLPIASMIILEFGVIDELFFVFAQLINLEKMGVTRLATSNLLYDIEHFS